jgi:hypothetical protein
MAYTTETQPVGEQQDESILDDYQSIDLDINTLVKKFIFPIDRYRSHNAPIVSGQLNQAGLPSTIFPQESRAHAFYRILGLPAVAPDGKFFNTGFNPLVYAEEERRRTDVCNSIPTAVKQLVQMRENSSRDNYGYFRSGGLDAAVFSVALAIPKGQRPLNVTVESESDRLTSLDNPSQQIIPIPVRKSVIERRYKQSDGSAITSFKDNVRHILAPFMTDPVIAANVDPKSGSASVMVAVPFLEDTEYERNKYIKRPGIEFILRLRLRQQNLINQIKTNVQNFNLSIFSTELSEDNQREIAAVLSDIGVDEVDLKQTLGNSGRIELLTLDNLVRTYKGLINKYINNIEIIEKVFQKIVWCPMSRDGGPEKGTEVSTEYIIPKQFLNSWELERRIRQLEIKASIASQQLDIGETAEAKPLAFSDFTISEFQNVADTFKSKLQEAKNERSKLEADASNALRSIEFISGEVSGLGLIDIIAIYSALWAVDITVLLNLIDDAAAKRLNDIPELKTDDTAARAAKQGSAADAYKKLARQIQAILSYGDKLFKSESGQHEEDGGTIPRQ